MAAQTFEHTEELVAELCSAFICAALGYSYEEAQSPAYIESWLKVLKQDGQAIFSIASYASQAADWLRDGPRSWRWLRMATWPMLSHKTIGPLGWGAFIASPIPV
jgi:antirestriction protein ArdC